MSTVNGFQVGANVLKYSAEALENYNTPNYSSSSTYAVGDYVMYQGKLYKCKTAITTAEAWTAAHWDTAILSNDVSDLKSEIDNIRQPSGLNLFNVETVKKDTGLDSSTGAEWSTNLYNCSDFIPAVAGQKYTIKTFTYTLTATYRVYAYNSSKQFIARNTQRISTAAAGGYVYTAPTNTAYIRLAFETSLNPGGMQDENTCVVAIGETTISAYIPYYTAYDKLANKEIDLTNDRLGIETKVIRNAYVNSSGVIVNGAWDTYCYKVKYLTKINRLSVGASSVQLIYACFTSEPSLGSTSYNNSRTANPVGTLVNEDFHVPGGCSWIAVRCALDDTPSINLADLTTFNNACINGYAIYSFDDLDNCRENSIYYVSKPYVPTNFPPNNSVGYLQTVRFDDNNVLQVFANAYGKLGYARAKVVGTWGSWYPVGESAVDTLAVSSSVSLFPKIGCCGDSFSAGYLYNKTDSEWYDPDYVPNGEYPAISYGKCMGRMYGVDVSLFAKGGLTSGQWRTDAAGLTALEAADPQNLYIICLGLNDKTQNVPIGVEADIDTEPGTPTYLGNMGAIIRAINTHAPLSKIILLKSPWVYNAGGSSANAYYNYNSSAIELLSSHLGIPYIETLGDPFFCCDAYVNGLKGLHPTAPLYAGMGKRIGELVGKCVIDNPTYFYNFYVPNP